MVQAYAVRMQTYNCFNVRLTNLMFLCWQMMAKSEERVAKLMESVAVIKVVVGVKRAVLVSLHQDHDEPFRTFATRVRSKVETCNFTIVSECVCENKMFQVVQKKQLKT